MVFPLSFIRIHYAAFYFTFHRYLFIVIAGIIHLNFLKMLKNYVGGSPNNQNEEWLDGKAVCHLLHISSRTLQTYRTTGLISYSQIGRKIYYKVSDIQDHLERNYVKSRYQEGGDYESL